MRQAVCPSLLELMYSSYIKYGNPEGKGLYCTVYNIVLPHF